MKRVSLFAGMLGFCLIMLVVAAYAQSPVRTYADQSVGVLSEDPITGERWSASIFPFGNYTGTVSGAAVFCRTYLRFPLDALPPGATVQAATLYVYVDDYWPGPGGAPMAVYPVLAEWTPEGVNWYDSAAWPALGAAAATTMVSSEGEWFSWDVTALAQGWTSGAPNYGLAVAAADPGSTSDNWAAARRLTADDPATRPYLEIAYTAPQPTATPRPPEPQPPPAEPAPPAAPAPALVLLPETGADLQAAVPWLLLAGGGLALLTGAVCKKRAR